MRFDREEAFARNYKEQGAGGVILLYGEEAYLVEAWRRRILKQFGGDDGFNLQRLDGGTPNWDDLFDATQALPLMASEKCVLLDDLDASKVAAADLKQLEEIFAECPPECTLLITARPPRFDAKSATGKKIAAAADKAGRAVQLSSRGEAGLVQFLQQIAAREGCAISPALCRKLLERTERDMQNLSREMEKICAYAGEGEITEEQILAVATPRVEARIFDLGKAITAGNGQRAMEIIDDLFYLRESPVGILATLCMNYVDLYRARVARDRGLPAGEVVSRFGYRGREFRVNNAYRSPMSLEALRKSLDLLLDCDRRMKSSSMDDRVLLEQAVAGLLLLRGA